MALNFPNNPTIGDVFEGEGVLFIWTGTVWRLAAGGGVPRGGIIMWSGALDALPDGWALCDGAFGRPDLRGRFIVGAGDAYDPGDTGGAETVTLTEGQVPAHTHAVNLNTNAAGQHSHVYNQGPSWAVAPSSGTVTRAYLGSGTTPPQTNTGEAGNHAHNVSGNTAASGGGTAHENRPPYFALAYIIRL
jgi:microcystin-dependent protein